MPALIDNIKKTESTQAVLHPVQPYELAMFWPICAGYIQDGINAIKTVDTLENTYDRLSSAHSQLWAISVGEKITAAIVTHIEFNEKIKIGVIDFCGGSKAWQWARAVDLIEGYFESEGCELFRMVGREGWKKYLPDFRQVAVLLEKDLTNG